MMIMSTPNEPTYGGWTVVGRALSTPEHEITRQQIYAWWRKRDKNGFPDKIELNGRTVFDLAATTRWFESYVPNRGGRPLGVKNRPKVRQSQPLPPLTEAEAAILAA